MYNIESFISEFVSLFHRGFSWFFSTLDKFQFYGISLLDFILGLIVISVALPIVLNLLSGSLDVTGSYASRNVANKYNNYHSNKLADKSKKKGD